MSVATALIRPLYHLGEHRPALRGTRVRRAIFRTMESLSRQQADAARSIFEAAEPGERLPIERLPAMLEAAAAAKKPQRWDRRRPQDKARLRADEVRRSVSGRSVAGKRLIELACGDGRVAMHLAEQGASVTGVDLSDHAMAPEAAERVDLLVRDASALGVPDASVDAVYSFDAFEHFSDPAAVLSEVHRVLKPGGTLHTSFGPLWNSPFGAHQWGRLDLPYIHLLFDRSALDTFADATGRPRLTVSCNEKPLASFRRLFTEADERFDRVSYLEKFNVSFADRIAAFAPCFRASVGEFDELIVRSIEVTLRKR
ncbi:MAG TPA: class I SAM-dependent methyltransferase [Tepidisphaeraceae bacterium]|jgi:SAM-dependent methyltransferase